MTVRAKMKVVTVTPFHTSGPDEVNTEIRLMAIYDDNDPQNKSWSKYTPVGEARLVITNPAAINEFEAGKFYYLDFSPVE